MSPPSRRAFLKLAALWPLAFLRGPGIRPAAAATPADAGLDAFLDVSARLTGRTGLDRGLARTYLAALRARPRNAILLADLADGAADTAARTPAHLALEEAILIAWYTGTHEVDGERRRATRAGALMWSALGRRAPGLCAGPPSSWSEPPAGAR